MSGRRLKLLENEEFLLEAVPVRSIYCRKAWWMSLFGFPLLVISTLWPYAVLNFDLFSPFPTAFRWLLAASGFPLILLALFLTFGHFLFFYIEASRVSYVVTTRRIIIKRGFIISKEFVIFLDRVAAVKVVRPKTRSHWGTIKFIASRSDSETPFYMRKFPTEKYRGDVNYSLEALPDVDSVRHVIDNAIAGAEASTS